MARKNPIIENLKEDLRRAKLAAENEKELKNRALGKLEKYEEKDEEETRMVRDMRRREDEYRQQLEDQVSWMRRLVEQLCVPADKLKVLEEARINQVHVGMEPRRNY